jgi:hypothetical protein
MVYIRRLREVLPSDIGVDLSSQVLDIPEYVWSEDLSAFGGFIRPWRISPAGGAG